MGPTSLPPRRRYTLRRRAERQAETRSRILDSALAQFAAVGPAATTISAVAAGAKVERLTVYRHFPDDAALVGGAVERLFDRHRLPDMPGWFAERRPEHRLHRALADLYAFYRAAGPVVGSLLREAPAVASSRESLRPLTEPLAALPAALAEGWPTYGDHGRSRLVAVIRHAIGFETWWSLTDGSKLDDTDAVSVMVRLAATAAHPED
jgi:AcrR family transcriptional regulator